MNIADNTFFITGGSSGLGAGTAQVLAQAGGHVVLADVDAEHGEPLAAALGGVFVKTDVTAEDQVANAIATAQAAYGSLQGVVHCAGIGVAARILSKDGAHSLDLFRHVIDINLVGTFNVLRLCAQAMAAQQPGEDGERGAIVVTASVAAYEGQIGQAAYSAAKGGVVGLILPAARELARFGIRIMGIAPGIFDTPMLGILPEEARQSLGKQVPFPSRLGQPREFGLLAKHMLGNNMLNGEVVRLDGALRMQPK